MESPAPALGPFRAGSLVLLVLALAGGGAVAASRAALPATAAVPRAPAAPDSARADTAAVFRGGEVLLRGYFGAEPDSVSCHAAQCPRLDVLVATLPDPYDSRLDWSYDAQLEALRRAHETAGYVLDRYRIPDPDATVTRDGEKVPARHTVPGVLLFRAADPDSSALRLLYVVGEVPTAGVHRAALDAALAERQRLLSRSNPPKAARRGQWTAGPSADAIQVVGPTFSGSAPSLRRALDRWVQRPPRTDSAAAPRAVVVSGSATGAQNARILADSARISYQSTVRTDALFHSVLEKEVLPRLGILPSEVALLRESTTAYGQTVASGGAEMLVLTFPMNISALRRAYEGKPRGGVALDPRLAGMREDARVATSLLDTARLRETPRVVSSLSTASAESMLEEIVRTLRTHRIRAVGVLASDVRDKIFLAEEIRRRIPDAQLFTFESNTLYLRTDRSTALRGMLVLSSYPLVLENQRWSVGPGAAPRERVVFSSDGAQGTYNAAVRLLGHPGAELEATPPFRVGSAAEPPVWVSVLGRSQPLPLLAWTPPDAGTRAATPPVTEWLHPGTVGFPAFVLVLVLALCLAAASVLGVWRIDPRAPDRRGRGRSALPAAQGQPVAAAVPASATPPAPAAQGVLLAAWQPTARAARWAFQVAAKPFVTAERRSSISRERRAQCGSLLLHRELYAVLRLFALAGVLAPVAVLLWARPGALLPSWAHWTAALTLTSLWLLAVGAGLWRTLEYLREFAPATRRHAVRLDSRGRRTFVLELGGRALVLLAGCAHAVLSVLLVDDLVGLVRENPHFGLYGHRVLQLGGGASLLVPVLTAGAGFALWCTWHLGRVWGLLEPTPFEHACLARAGEPRVSRDAEDPYDRAAVAVRDARNRLFLLVPHPRALVLGAGMVLLVAWVLFPVRPTVEALVLAERFGTATAFDLLLRASIAAALVTTVWAVYRMVAAWSAQRRFLAAMEEMEPKESFERLPPYVAQMVRLSLLWPASRQALDALVSTAWDRLCELHRASQSVADAVAARGGGPGDGWQPGEWTGRVPLWSPWEPGARFAAVYHVLRELRREPNDDAAVRAWQQVAGEFTALQIVAYVEEAMRQLRRLAVFLFGSLLVTTLLVSGYPFQPQSLVKLVFLGVMAATVLSLLWVMTQVNANSVLSRMGGSTPGKVSWDVPFVLNTLAVAVVPLMALVSSESPELLAFLLAWLKPVMAALGAG